MRLQEITRLLIPGAVLLVAGAAAGQFLTTGKFSATDSRNENLDTRADVLVNDANGIEVNAECVASTGERVRFEFDAIVIDKSNITDKKANLDQKDKSNPATVTGILPGACNAASLDQAGDRCFLDPECGTNVLAGACNAESGANAGKPCFANNTCGTFGSGARCNDPLPEPAACNDPPVPTGELLTCDKVRVSTRITPSKTTVFKADASKCTSASAPLVAAAEAACKDRENRGIRIRASGTAGFNAIKVSGRGDTK